MDHANATNKSTSTTRRLITTSRQQYQIMIMYMEQYGDMSSVKNGKDIYRRADLNERWLELTNLLNSEPYGKKKSVEKWRKVWSDVKVYTKRKAYKLGISENGSLESGESAVGVIKSFTDYDRRILNLIGKKSLRTNKDYLKENLDNQDLEDLVVSLPPPETCRGSKPISPSVLVFPLKPYENPSFERTDASIISFDDALDEFNNSTEVVNDTMVTSEDTNDGLENRNDPLQHTDNTFEVTDYSLNDVTGVLSDTTIAMDHTSKVLEEQPGPLLKTGATTPKLHYSEPIIIDTRESIIPDIEGQTRPKREVPKPQRHITPNSKHAGRRKVAKMNESFLKFVMKRESAGVDMEKERLRLRELELDIQKRWQEVAIKAIDALSKVVDAKFS